jgi:hypothetical protein
MQDGRVPGSAGMRASGPGIVICSCQFAKSKAGDVHAVPWDLAVIDEAHRLRNQKRRTLFEAQDQVDAQREELIAQIENKLAQVTQVQRLFMIRWALI